MVGLLSLQATRGSDRIKSITQDDSSEDEEGEGNDPPPLVEEQEVDQLSALNCGSSDFEAVVPEGC